MAEKAKKEAAKIVRMAFIGYGIQGRTVLVPQFIKQEEVVVKAVCDCDKTRREAAAEFVNNYYKENKKAKLAKCKAVADFRDIIADKDIDAVCIAVPDHWHAYISCAAMKAGKDVYCEKPLTYSVEESVLVMKAQKKFKRIFQTGAMQRSWREFRTACMIVRNGFIGKIKYVDCNYGNASAQNNTDIANVPANLGGPSHPHRFFAQWSGGERKIQDIATESAPNPDVDWDMWLGPAPWSPYSDQCAPRG
ncbi:MAG: Gfo/Idh/MocA family oxidoreductase, partial [Victivallales bacterium]|nr:Gfo/Idh/MocA family oxidoreductase [Victivallales bacterium]